MKGRERTWPLKAEEALNPEATNLRSQTKVCALELHRRLQAMQR